MQEDSREGEIHMERKDIWKTFQRMKALKVVRLPLDSTFLNQVGELSRALWCKPVISAFERPREDNQRSRGPGYTASHGQP